MDIRICGIIPARYASTRFPGKPLADIGGKSMIRRVYEQASRSASLQKVIVATDDPRIAEHVTSFGGAVMMTSTAHRTGTDRCAEVARQLESSGQTYDVYINIQGDEPFIDPEQINTVARCFQDPATMIATLRKPLHNADELFNPNIIKVTCDQLGQALYFSRSPIPFVRGKEKEHWIGEGIHFKHIGLYAYRAGVLHKISALEPGKLETAESLEQLRWLENGYTIRVEITHSESHSIDTPEDLEKCIGLF